VDNLWYMYNDHSFIVTCSHYQLFVYNNNFLISLLFTFQISNLDTKMIVL